MIWMLELSTLIKLAFDTEAGSVANALEDRTRIQNDLDKMEIWSVDHKKKFSED